MRHNLLYGPRTPIKGKLDPGLMHVCQSTQGNNLIRYLKSRELNLGLEVRGDGGEVGCHPITFFFNFFQADLLSAPTVFRSVAVHLSLRHVLVKILLESVALVTRYGVISRMRSSHFLKIKMCLLTGIS